MARRCGAKHIFMSKCTKHTRFGPLFEVRMLKNCTPLWREAHLQVKMYKTHQVRTTWAYLQIWNHWACCCQCHLQMPAEAPLSLLLDFLHALDHLKRRKDSKPSRTLMMTHIKALRWMAFKLDLPLNMALQSQTVSDFLKSQTRIPFERSEATPIPAAAL